MWKLGGSDMTTEAIVNRRQLVLTASGTVLAAISGFPAFGAKLGSVKFGVASIDPYSAPIYIADKLGYWTQEGLDVEYLNSQSGPRSKQMLAAKQLFMTSTGMNDSIALTLAGKPAVVVLGIDNPRLPISCVAMIARISRTSPTLQARHWPLLSPRQQPG
jgi:ABC-type nitrate/sulfonate/bicarbonate transport system substrate-binding protein